MTRLGAQRIVSDCKAEMTAAVSSIIDNCHCDLGNRSTVESLIQDPSTNGHLKWKIAHFSSRKKEAYNGKCPSLYSAPFYASKYKMRLKLYINGFNEGKNSHMSLSVVILKGEHDHTLSWPVKINATFQLINVGCGDNWVAKFSTSPLDRPMSDEVEISAGYSQFVSNSHYAQGDFVLDDTMFIKCDIDLA